MILKEHSCDSVLVVWCTEQLNWGVDVCERVQSGHLVTTLSVSPEDEDCFILLMAWGEVPGRGSRH